MKNVKFLPKNLEKRYPLFDKEVAKQITEQGRCTLIELFDKLKENGFELKGIKKIKIK